MAKKLGFTLIEVVVAAAVFAAVSIPIFFVFGSSQRNLQMTEAEFRAHNAALEVMEQTLSNPFKLIKAGVYGSDVVKNGEKFGLGVFEFRRSSDLPCEIVIDDISQNGRILFKKITVSVEYMPTNGGTQTRKTVLKTMVANEQNI